MRVCPFLGSGTLPPRSNKRNQFWAWGSDQAESHDIKIETFELLTIYDELKGYVSICYPEK